MDKSQFHPASSSVNEPKNRYRNILPCELDIPSLLLSPFTPSPLLPPPPLPPLPAPLPLLSPLPFPLNFLFPLLSHHFTDDRYRVRLLLHPGVNGSDYINASYVDVSSTQIHSCDYHMTCHMMNRVIIADINTS